jgi:hypothetical protein
MGSSAGTRDRAKPRWGFPRPPALIQSFLSGSARASSDSMGSCAGTGGAQNDRGLPRAAPFFGAARLATLDGVCVFIAFWHASEGVIVRKLFVDGFFTGRSRPDALHNDFFRGFSLVLHRLEDPNKCLRSSAAGRRQVDHHLGSAFKQQEEKQ